MRPIQTRLDEQLISQAKRLDALTQCLKQSLPLECEGHYHVTRLQQGTLHLITDSPVWTTKMRQLGPRILEVLTQAGIKNLQHVNITSRVNYQPPARPAPVKVRRELSREAGEQIARSADYIEDEALSNALKKLASRGDDTTTD